MDFTGAFCQKEMGALRKNGDSMPDTTVRELIVIDQIWKRGRQ